MAGIDMNCGLDNGATVESRAGNTILAKWDHKDEWIVATHFDGDESWNCGHYFRSSDEAMAYFVKRTSEELTERSK